jgi:hypothetical protein
MKYKFAVAALAVVACGVFVHPANSAQRSRRHHPRPVQHHYLRSVPPQAQPYIACTVLGCAPVPRGCLPVEGKTPGGIPTGFDVVACPPGVAPFR